MKTTFNKAMSGIMALPIIVGVIWGYAALAGDVNKNSIHTLQANMDRWTYLKIQWEEREQTPAVKREVARLQRQIAIALAEVKSRQERN
jgi:hypothetical protein